MFDFLSMMGTYESRKVARFDKDKLMVSTCVITDSEQPYETAVRHPAYNNGKIVIVELYPTRQKAKQGHDRWVKKMTAKNLPESLKDVSSCTITHILDLGGKKWRKREKVNA